MLMVKFSTRHSNARTKFPDLSSNDVATWRKPDIDYLAVMSHRNPVVSNKDRNGTNASMGVHKGLPDLPY